MTALQLKAARRKLGFSQHELAEVLHMSTGHVSKMERNVVKVQETTALAIINMLSTQEQEKSDAE